VDQFNSKNYSIYANFLNKLAKELTKFYFSKLNKTFKVSNKLKGKGYDPVTTSDKAFEKFIRSKIKKKFPDHQVIGEEFGQKKTKSDYTWVIDPIDGTRSFVIGNPTWSNLISLNYKDTPILGLANFPILKKYYINFSDKIAYVVHNGKRKKISVNKKAIFKDVKVSAAFHGWLSLDKQKKIPQILKLIQCSNKIWDIHPLIPIIKAAGGYISTWDNRDAINAGNILVSSNKTMHNKFLKLLKPVSK
jgi:myo-inositol-1(or 4)-monophosphatase